MSVEKPLFDAAFDRPLFGLSHKTIQVRGLVYFDDKVWRAAMDDAIVTPIWPPTQVKPPLFISKAASNDENE